MKTPRRKSNPLCALIAFFIAMTAVLAAWSGVWSPDLAAAAPAATAGDSRVRLSAVLAQDNVLKGSDGMVAVAVSLAAAELPGGSDRPAPPADLVVVLDRSGSMEGAKIEDARRAVLHLIDRLGASDRLALVAYSNAAQTICPLVPVDGRQRAHLTTAVNRIYAQGGTNLGDGLEQGLGVLRQTHTAGLPRMRKVILISDGLANLGVTDPHSLSRLASSAAEHGWAVSTVGVGHDFNELLMTSIADHGAGRYYFLEDPSVMAHVFEQEFQATRRVAAGGIELRIQVKPGMKLIHAGGYPIRRRDGWDLVAPGDLLSGLERKLFLTFQVPTEKERAMALGDLELHYRHDDAHYVLRGSGTLALACVADPQAVVSGIDKAVWSDQVVQEEFSRLKEDVAESLRKGEKDRAMKQISDYADRNQAINAVVGSAAVAQNLEKELPALTRGVEETFAGAPPEVEAKRKQNAKAMQYDSYLIRRDKKY